MFDEFGENAPVAPIIERTIDGKPGDPLAVAYAGLYLKTSSFKYLQNVYSSNDVENQNISVALMMSDVLLKTEGVSRVAWPVGFAGTIQAFVKMISLCHIRCRWTAFMAGSCRI